MWSAAAAANLPLVMARIGGATPFADVVRFARESAELTRQAAAAQSGVRFLAFGAPEAAAPGNVAYVTSGDARADHALWGRLGTAANGAGGDDAKAARFFNLPE
jgi:hypothetical protein